MMVMLQDVASKSCGNVLEISWNFTNKVRPRRQLSYKKNGEHLGEIQELRYIYIHIYIYDILHQLMLVYNLSPKHSRWVPSLFLRCYLRGVELQDPKGWYSQSLIEKNCLGGLEHVLFLTMSSSQLTKSIIFSIFWGNFIIPTDEVHHFSEGLGSTTNEMIFPSDARHLFGCHGKNWRGSMIYP